MRDVTIVRALRIMRRRESRFFQCMQLVTGIVCGAKHDGSFVFGLAQRDLVGFQMLGDAGVSACRIMRGREYSRFRGFWAVKLKLFQCNSASTKGKRPLGLQANFGKDNRGSCVF